MTSNDRIEEKGGAAALGACIAYDQGAADVARLTKEIGRALDGCWRAQGEPEHDEHLEQWESCLRRAYEAVTAHGRGRLYRPDLSHACEHCRRAHDLIQERKAARQRFGEAKRAIRRAAKKARTRPNDGGKEANRG